MFWGRPSSRAHRTRFGSTTLGCDDGRGETRENGTDCAMKLLNASIANILACIVVPASPFCALEFIRHRLSPPIRRSSTHRSLLVLQFQRMHSCFALTSSFSSSCGSTAIDPPSSAVYVVSPTLLLVIALPPALPTHSIPSATCGISSILAGLFFPLCVQMPTVPLLLRVLLSTILIGSDGLLPRVSG